MSNINVTYREATELEAKFYWGKVDLLKANHDFILSRPIDDKTAHLMEKHNQEKSRTYDLLVKIGYRSTKEGLLIREEEDILNAEYNENMDRAVTQDWADAMYAMHTGKSTR